jgi:hypothetical protein
MFRGNHSGSVVYIFCTIPSGGEISEVVDVELLDGIGVGYSDV